MARDNRGKSLDLPREKEFARALVELFAVADAVFTEPEAFKNPATVGRLYRAWQAARAILDPDWEKTKHLYARRRYE